MDPQRPTRQCPRQRPAQLLAPETRQDFPPGKRLGPPGRTKGLRRDPEQPVLEYADDTVALDEGGVVGGVGVGPSIYQKFDISLPARKATAGFTGRLREPWRGGRAVDCGGLENRCG